MGDSARRVKVDARKTRSAGGLTVQEVEDRYRILIENVKDYSVLMLDKEGRIATWNAGAERIKGYRADEIVGQHFSKFYPREDVESGKCETELKVAAAEGRVEDTGWRLRKDGSRFWANVVITALRNKEGRLLGFGKVTRDLSEILKHQDAIRELSTPVLQIGEGFLILPVIGVIDTQRARQLTESLLHAIRSKRVKVAVMDITGVPTVDSKVANHLVQTVSAAKLMGATVIITGLSPEIAQTLVTLGVDLSRILTVADLMGGVEEADRILGNRIVKTDAVGSGTRSRPAPG